MYLELETGQKFYGKSFGYPVSKSGEVVFQTGMVGYPESLTDPSYNQQILVLTYPLIGNYGIPNDEKDENNLLCNFESNKIWISGLVVGEYNPQYSHWKGVKNLGDWLKENGIPAISGIDTRQLTLIIREYGTIKGKLINDKDDIDFIDIDKINLVAEVSTNVRIFNNPNKTDINLLVYDFGIKYSQIRSLINRGFNLTVVPWNFIPSDEELKQYNGIFLSNGPGNPETCVDVINFLFNLIINKVNIPIFGICLGHQILSLASGAKVSKMKFGNRGHNIPVRFLETKRCLITSQNHGYAVETESLSSDWIPLFTNANDDSNEGIIHRNLPYYSVQFHPEAKAGPEDAGFLFDIFRDLINGKSLNTINEITKNLIQEVKPNKTYNKVLILGSGGLSIGQAGEFDYSGSQAIKAYKQSGLKTVLINPNIATIQTSVGLADKIYSLPLTLHFVKEVIEIERPDCIALSFGGQTALNTGIELFKKNVLSDYDIDVLGTPIESIEATEDRQMFKEILQSIDEKIAVSKTVYTIEDAINAGQIIGYPVLVRSAFTLGGLGSGFAQNETELINLIEPILKTESAQAIIDKSFKGWKEVEYEIVRDKYDNCISVCNMENLDPLGVHTGESIVVAPSQTLTDNEYNKLRSVAFKIVRKVGIIGECNIQYALDPHSDDYFIIEMNARLSRSSALASKATGYPLAYIAAKISLGESLVDLKNSVTKNTSACFEPSLDYCVVKVPRWDLKKFPLVSTKIGSSMKSVGEVMAISRSFEEALQKGLRMANEDCNGFDPFYYSKSIMEHDNDLINPTYDRMFLIAKLMYQKVYDVDDIHRMTNIDYWFIKKFQKIIDMYWILDDTELSKLESNSDILLKTKRRGFSDLQIAKMVEATEPYIRSIRLKHNITPWIKIIDTVAGEFKCQTNYCYLTYHGNSHDITPIGNSGIIVLGSGVYRIGSSVEFDWCAVNCIRQIREKGHKAIMINYNPETVSTDYDEADRLYFDELSFEIVMDIYQFEDPKGVILSMGGQIPNNIAMDLFRQKVRVLGTSPENIDNAENRFKFSRMLDQIDVDQPKWKESTNLEDTITFCHYVGYPVLIRPSYVLSGAAMKVIYSDEQLESSLTGAAMVSKDYPVVVSKFIDDAKEIEVDAVSNNGWVEIFAISEHVENAGVHSGDATLILPSQNLTPLTTKFIKKSVYKISQALKIHGPFNIQFIAKDDRIMVIECNLRVSRTFPFVSKTLDANFIKIATNIILDGEKTDENILNRIMKQETINNKIGVKVPQFSFNRLGDTDVKLGVEMVSTGEVACYGKNAHDAYLKGLRASGFDIPNMHTIESDPKNNILISIGSYKYKKEFIDYIKLLSTKFNIYTTYGTYDFYSEYFRDIYSAINVKLHKTDTNTDLINLIKQKFFKLIINISDPNKNYSIHKATLGYYIRTNAVKFNIPVITNIKCAKLLVNALFYHYDDYINVTDIDCMLSYKIVKIPMLFDMHVHFRDLDESYSGTWESESIASIVGGVSDTIVMPNTTPSIDNYELLEKYNDIASRNSHVNYLLTILGTSILANNPNIKLEMNKMATLAIGMKIFLNGSHIKSHQVTNSIEDWHSLLKNWPSNRMVFIHCENPIMLMGFLFVAKLYHHHYHLCHLKSKEELDIVEYAKCTGILITTEISLHHLLLNNTISNIKVCSELIDENNRQYLLKNLHRIDCFVSEHAPLSQQKENQYHDISSIEHIMNIYGYAINTGVITIDMLIDKTFTKPRQIFKLPTTSKNYIEVNFNYTKVIDKPKYSLGLNCSYTGINAGCCIQRIVINNEIIVMDDKILKKPYTKNLINDVNTIIQTDEYMLGELLFSDESNNCDYLDEIKDIDTTVDIKHKNINFNYKDIISVDQFDRDQIKELCIRAQELKELIKQYGTLDILAGKTFINVFYEPSTRTRLSFESAIHKLGGNVMSFMPEVSSIKKGESFTDTIKTVETYSDCIILRSPYEGLVSLAASTANIPVINAGDGKGEHPTQALLDIFTIRQERGSIYNITITFTGDLKNSRTVHSLVKLLALYDNIRFYYICDESLQLPQKLQDELYKINPNLEQYHDDQLDKVLYKTDVLYLTRFQSERNDKTINNYKFPQLTPKLLANAKKNLIILHPLPRNNEIDVNVDIDPRACYFRQMEYGLYMRMALLEMLIKK
jgi:carbamoyl-phosphate synthase/aspartate carbamoyltransferase/dihydroorotase